MRSIVVAVILLLSTPALAHAEVSIVARDVPLRGAGEFNDLLLLPDAAWESMEAARSKK